MAERCRRPEVLREYALLADGERGALIGPRGDVAWLCAPRWDSEAVFTALLGGAGEYTVSPTDGWFVPGGFYEEDSLIWRCRWRRSGGATECREALAYPGDPHTVVLLRRIHAVDGDAELMVRLDPRAGYGRRPMRGVTREAGAWHARTGGLHLRWSGCPQAREVDGGLSAVLRVPAGGSHDLVLEISDRPLAGRSPDPDRAWEATEYGWRADAPRPAGVGARDVRHAYAVHKGMTSGTGGMVSACTTSMPERARAGRNYDYRYAWIRDQCYAGRALLPLAGGPLADRLVGFIAERVLADGPQLRPAYTVDGAAVPDEQPINHLPGYPGGWAVVGNRAGDQFQLDVLGEALLLFAAAAEHDRLEADHWRAVESLAAAVGKRWREPDAGVWELAEDRWAHSRLICAAGLRAAGQAAPRGQASDWSALADTIVADTTRDCLHPTGRWQRAPDDPRVDAALLLPAVRGAVPAHDPRSHATLAAVRAELAEDGHMYRFRHDERPLYEAEGAFLLCGFVTALAYHQQGDPVAARGWFERTRSACGPPGLYAEEYDVLQRQLRGNLPQTFVHSLLVEAASTLGHADA